MTEFCRGNKSNQITLTDILQHARSDLSLQRVAQLAAKAVQKDWLVAPTNCSDMSRSVFELNKTAT